MKSHTRWRYLQQSLGPLRKDVCVPIKVWSNVLTLRIHKKQPLTWKNTCSQPISCVQFAELQTVATLWIHRFWLLITAFSGEVVNALLMVAERQLIYQTLCVLFLQLLAVRPSLALSVTTTSICSCIKAALEGLTVPIGQTWSLCLPNGTLCCFLTEERQQHLSAGLRGSFKGPRAHRAPSLRERCFLPIIILQAFARQTQQWVTGRVLHDSCVFRG